MLHEIGKIAIRHGKRLRSKSEAGSRRQVLIKQAVIVERFKSRFQRENLKFLASNSRMERRYTHEEGSSKF